MNELIKDYHNRKIIPVMSRGEHEEFLKEYIGSYEEDGFPALEIFASQWGFEVSRRDHGFRFEFYPARSDMDCAEWPREEVPVNRPRQ